MVAFSNGVHVYIRVIVVGLVCLFVILSLLTWMLSY